jgi:hypothetical protein
VAACGREAEAGCAHWMAFCFGRLLNGEWVVGLQYCCEDVGDVVSGGGRVICIKYGRRAIGCLLDSNSQCGHVSLLAPCVVVGRKTDACSRSRTAQVIDRKQTVNEPCDLQTTVQTQHTSLSPLSKQVQNPSQPITTHPTPINPSSPAPSPSLPPPSSPRFLPHSPQPHSP